MIHGHPSKCLAPLLPALLLLLAMSMLPDMALADGIRGFVEWDYSIADLTTKDNTTGVTTKTTFDTFMQKYNLFLDRNIFPNLKLDAGGLFEKDETLSRTDGTQTIATDRNVNGFVDLTLSTRLYMIGVGYNKRIDTQGSTGSSPTTLINEDSNAAFSWKPDELPAVDFRYDHIDLHDGLRLVTNSLTDQSVLSMKYDPIRQLDLRYSASIIDIDDKLTGLITDTTTQTGKITYSDAFFDRRMSVASDYTITSRDTSVSGNVSGSVNSQLFPTAGLLAVSTLTTPPTNITLVNTPALIDGITTVSAGVDIGLAPTQSGDTSARNIGLDFFNPTAVSTLWVWVDKDLSTIFGTVPNVSIASQFSWAVYTSSDNITWTQTAAPAVATFGPFQNRFVVTFPQVTSRYIKVVVFPLGSPPTPQFGFPASSPASIIGQGFPVAAISDIYVTELQAFVAVSAKSLSSTASSLSQALNLNSRIRLLDTPGLSYDFSLFLTHSTPNPTTTAFMSNGLSLSHKFWDIFTTNARVAREDDYEETGHQVAYTYSGSLTAKPLLALSDSIVYSGRNTSLNGQSTSTQSILTYNNAELYPGINAILSGGVSLSKLASGQNTTSYTMNFGTTLIPHPTMSVNLTYGLSDAVSSGGGLPGSSALTYLATASVAYTPVRALYIFLSITLNELNNSLLTTQNYGLNFSPFPDGALQFHFSYNESLQPQGQGRTTLLTPSLRWNIRPGAYLDLSYVLQQTIAAVENTESKILSTTLNITF
ncbi:MAG: hypothetical protein ABSG42_02810 [Nitrospirota bacterium]